MEHAPAAGTATTGFRQTIAKAFTLLRDGRIDEARQLSDALLASQPENAEALYLGGEVRAAQGDAADALALMSRAAAAAPDQLPLLLKQARLQLALRQRLAARATAEAALVLAGKDGHALWEVARIFSQSNDLQRAQQIYLRALAAGNHDPSLRYDLAVGQFFAGDFAAAEQNIDAVLIAAPLAGHALYRRSTLRTQTESRNHVAELQSRLPQARTQPQVHAACLFALAKELDDLGRPAESFNALAEAAAIKRKTLNYDAAKERASIEAIRTAYDAVFMAEQTPGCPAEGAIFVVGMPRTGSTLVERVLSGHSDVQSAGELLDFSQALASATLLAARHSPSESPVEASKRIDFAALGVEYLRGAREAAAPSRMFIDKMPINFMYCGLIHKALPNARIVHVHRDPMDTCYAIYQTLFNQAYPFSCDLQELAAYYATYQRLMQHWHAVMPGRILDVSYEALLTDTPAQARRLLDYCGLDWQAACLDPGANPALATTASAAQVRQPIHTRSVQKWRRVEAQLAPLKAALIEAGVDVQ